MNLNLAVFDLAGTTVMDDNYVLTAFQNAFKNNKLSVSDEEINSLMGYHKPTAIQILLEKKEFQSDREFINKIHHNFENEMLDFYEYSPQVKPMPDAEDIFFFLKDKGTKVAVNTGFSKVVAATILSRFKWLDRGLVDDYIASDEVKEGRPFPDMINTLKERLRIGDKDKVMKVGDTVVDIQEAQNAGCDYIVAVTTGATLRKELEKYRPTYIVDCLSEIPALLNTDASLYV